MVRSSDAETQPSPTATESSLLSPHHHSKGIGRHVWSSEASYQGEWRQGMMHGVGTYESACGRSRYSGGWVKDVKSGLGKQVFSSGDIYEGLWEKGLPNGPGRYKFYQNQCEYDGEWSNGKMHGHGMMNWSGNGVIHSGEWANDRQHGLGLVIRPDGSTFLGQWVEGRKHGVGIERSTKGIGNYQAASAFGRKVTSNLLLNERSKSKNLFSRASRKESFKERKDSDKETELGVSNSLTDSDALSHSYSNILPGRSVSRSFSSAFALLGGAQAVTSPTLGKGSKGGSFTTAGTSPTPFFAALRTFDRGLLVKEEVISAEDADSLINPLRRGISAQSASRPIAFGSTFGKKPSIGSEIHRSHQIYQLVVALQLGLRYSVGRVTTDPAPKNLSSVDFEVKVKQHFPSEGTDMTPAHCGEEDFTWKDYAPVVFRKLREDFNVDAGAYVQSLCASELSLRLLSSPGKSGAFFFITSDDRYFIKSLKQGETSLMFEMLPDYFRHLEEQPHTLITRFYGLHRVIIGSKKIDLVVMENIFFTKLHLHRRYDLKGSTLGRTAGVSSFDDPDVIYKDLDLKGTFRLEKGWKERLSMQLESDCGLLCSSGIMDYSLLLGVHFPNRADMAEKHESEDDIRLKELFPELMKRIKGMNLSLEAKDALMSFVSCHERAIRTPSDLSSKSQGENKAESLALRLGQSRVQLGLNLPATFIPFDHNEGEENCIIWLGIIDILQSYNPQKQLEHRLKSLVHTALSISVTHPKTYSERFQKFLARSFI
jgi:1-phosphatidylinositol-4-phosphate 5-kinase